MATIRLLHDGTWSKAPVLTAARKILIDGLAKHVTARPLGNIASFLNGTSYDQSLLSDTGTPIIRISNISNPRSEYIATSEQFDPRYHVVQGDLLVSWSASFKSIIWPGPRGILNQHIFKVTETPGHHRPYIRHAIEAVFDEMQQKVVGIGMMHLRRRDFLGHLVPAPDFGIQQRVSDFLDWIEFGCVGAEPELPSFLENQRRIVARLDQLSATIEEARRLRSASVETTEALMLSTLSHLSEDLLARYHAQPLERLTSYIGDMNHEMPKGAENGIPFISPKDFTSDGKVDFVGAKRISQDDFLRLSEKCRPEKGDILMARYGTIGAARLVETDEPFLASYSIAIIRPLLAEVNNRFLGSPREFVKAFKYRGFSEMAFLGRLGG